MIEMMSNNWEWMPLPLKVAAVALLAAGVGCLLWLLFYGEV